MHRLQLKKLLEPTHIGRMKLKNRLVSAPMLMNYASQDGFVTSQLLDFYETLAKGGPGLIIGEGTCVEAPRGRVRDYQLVLDDDKFIPGLKELVRVVERHGAQLAIQLMHSGPNSELRITHMQRVGPSPLSSPVFPSARELSISELKDIAVKFGNAAERAKRTGFAGVEIHAGHSYLIAPFLSSATNKRSDNYGGSLENRARFLMEIYQAVREAVGRTFPVWCRINGKEFGTENGLTIEESQSIAVMLEKAGADAIVLSCGGTGKYAGYSSGIMYDPPGNLVHLAEAIKTKVRMPVIAVGKLDVQLAETVLQEGKADLVAIGRGLLADPDLLKKAIAGKLEDIRPCIWCRVCGDVFLQVRASPVRCQVNASLGHEKEWELKAPVVRKKVLIAGGGPAGMEAARVTAQRGHDVTLYEKGPALGGQMLLAAMVPFKTDPIQSFTDYLTTQLKKLGVKIVLGSEVTPSVVRLLKPDAVILATGVSPLFPKIPGLNSSNSIAANALLRDKIEVGDNVVILGGGMIGCDIASYLSEKGKKVTLLEMLSGVVADLGARNISRVSHRLLENGVSIKTDARCLAVKGHEVVFLDSDNLVQTTSADTIVVATDPQPNRDLCEPIGKLVHETYLIGDCIKPGWILEAVATGFRVARDL